MMRGERLLAILLGEAVGALRPLGLDLVAAQGAGESVEQRQ